MSIEPAPVSSPDQPSLAALVRASRERALLTQEQLAARTGLGVRTIRRLESDRLWRPRAESMRSLAEALELTGAEREQLIAAARARPTTCGDAAPARRERPAEQAMPARGPAVVPRQLPVPVRYFVGRTEQLAALTRRLEPGSKRARTVIISAIGGSPGVGKTALAVHWAHQVADEFPDGQLYVNLRGYDPNGPPLRPAEALRGFLDAFALPAHRIPGSLDAQAALYRSLLSGRRMLVVLDNARDAEQVRPLLPGAPTCQVLVTSRTSLTGLTVADGAEPLALDLFSLDESRQLLAFHLGHDRVAAAPAAVDDIVARCARLPLALAIVAARAAEQPTFPLAAFAAELNDTQRRLDALDGGDHTSQVRAAFTWSYDRLSPDAARLFRLLSLHPGPDITAAAAASLIGVAAAQVRTLLTELATTRLLTEHTPGRYAFHDLLRAYAAEHVEHAEGLADRRAAIRRALDHYLHTSHAAARLLAPHRDEIVLTHPDAGATPERLADKAQAAAWFRSEHQVLLAAVDCAAGSGLDVHTWQLAWTLDGYLDLRGDWQDLAATQRVALAATCRLADATAQALIHRLLARACIRLRRFDDAHTHLGQALDLARRAGDRVAQAHIHLRLAQAWARQNRHTDAIHDAQKALKLYDCVDHRWGQANALNNIGWYHALRGEHQQALTICERALALLQDLGDRPGQAATWDSLGLAHHHLGNHAQALACYRRALNLHHEAGNRYYEADTLTHLGDTHVSAGDPEQARVAWRRALEILDELDHPDAEQLRAKLSALDQVASTPSSVLRPTENVSQSVSADSSRRSLYRARTRDMGCELAIRAVVTRLGGIR
jgi:tetratricopeptide (TPR) repeat protein/transcriptional regulator with XRE-family HTH domain